MYTFNIMGVDPGTNYVGVSVFEINVQTLEIVSITPLTISLSKIQETTFSPAMNLRLFELKNQMRHIVATFNPVSITIEHGFINKLRPAAYGPLSMSINTVQSAAFDVNPFSRIFMISPSEIKMNVGATFKADKDMVLAAMNKIGEITAKVNLNSISEHAVDATAIAYGHLKNIRETGVLGLCLV